MLRLVLCTHLSPISHGKVSSRDQRKVLTSFDASADDETFVAGVLTREKLVSRIVVMDLSINSPCMAHMMHVYFCSTSIDYCTISMKVWVKL